MHQKSIAELERLLQLTSDLEILLPGVFPAEVWDTLKPDWFAIFNSAFETVQDSSLEKCSEQKSKLIDLYREFLNAWMHLAQIEPFYLEDNYAKTLEYFVPPKATDSVPKVVEICNKLFAHIHSPIDRWVAKEVFSTFLKTWTDALLQVVQNSGLEKELENSFEKAVEQYERCFRDLLPRHIHKSISSFRAAHGTGWSNPNEKPTGHRPMEPNLMTFDILTHVAAVNKAAMNLEQDRASNVPSNSFTFETSEINSSESRLTRKTRKIVRLMPFKNRNREAEAHLVNHAKSPAKEKVEPASLHRFVNAVPTGINPKLSKVRIRLEQQMGRCLLGRDPKDLESFVRKVLSSDFGILSRKVAHKCIAKCSVLSQVWTRETANFKNEDFLAIFETVDNILRFLNGVASSPESFKSDRFSGQDLTQILLHLLAHLYAIVVVTSDRQHVKLLIAKVCHSLRSCNDAVDDNPELAACFRVETSFLKQQFLLTERSVSRMLLLCHPSDVVNSEACQASKFPSEVLVFFKFRKNCVEIALRETTELARSEISSKLQLAVLKTTLAADATLALACCDEVMGQDGDVIIDSDYHDATSTVITLAAFVKRLLSRLLRLEDYLKSSNRDVGNDKLDPKPRLEYRNETSELKYHLTKVISGIFLWVPALKSMKSLVADVPSNVMISDRQPSEELRKMKAACSRFVSGPFWRFVEKEAFDLMPESTMTFSELSPWFESARSTEKEFSKLERLDDWLNMLCVLADVLVKLSNGTSQFQRSGPGITVCEPVLSLFRLTEEFSAMNLPPDLMGMLKDRTSALLRTSLRACARFAIGATLKSSSDFLSAENEDRISVTSEALKGADCVQLAMKIASLANILSDFARGMNPAILTVLLDFLGDYRIVNKRNKVMASKPKVPKRKEVPTEVDSQSSRNASDGNMKRWTPAAASDSGDGNADNRPPSSASSMASLATQRSESPGDTEMTPNATKKTLLPAPQAGLPFGVRCTDPKHPYTQEVLNSMARQPLVPHPVADENPYGIPPDPTPAIGYFADSRASTNFLLAPKFPPKMVAEPPGFPLTSTSTPSLLTLNTSNQQPTVSGPSRSSLLGTYSGGPRLGFGTSGAAEQTTKDLAQSVESYGEPATTDSIPAASSRAPLASKPEYSELMARLAAMQRRPGSSKSIKPGLLDTPSMSNSQEYAAKRPAAPDSESIGTGFGKFRKTEKSTEASGPVLGYEVPNAAMNLGHFMAKIQGEMQSPKFHPTVNESPNFIPDSRTENSESVLAEQVEILEAQLFSLQTRLFAEPGDSDFLTTLFGTDVRNFDFRIRDFCRRSVEASCDFFDSRLQDAQLCAQFLERELQECRKEAQQVSEVQKITSENDHLSRQLDILRNLAMSRTISSGVHSNEDLARVADRFSKKSQDLKNRLGSSGQKTNNVSKKFLDTMYTMSTRILPVPAPLKTREFGTAGLFENLRIVAASFQSIKSEVERIVSFLPQSDTLLDEKNRKIAELEKLLSQF